MNAATFKHQVIRDLKASWPKTAALVVLLGVGLVIWSSQLFKAITGTSETPDAAASSAATAEPRSLLQTAEASANDRAPVPFTWQGAEQALQTDPLVQSAELAAIGANPFRMDPDQFPPVVSFAEEPKPSPPNPASPARAPRNSGEGLVLKSTIVGVQRRAAFINSNLYFEGAQIRTGGQTFLLVAVRPKSVVLQGAAETFELTIAEPTLDDRGIEVEASRD